MGSHQLFEWEARRFEAADAIPLHDAERLVRAAAGPAAKLGKGLRAFDFGREALTAQHLVGIVVTGGVNCEILPKIDRDAIGDTGQLRHQLIRMLDVAYDLPIADDGATALGRQDDTLLEVLIARFAALLADAVRRGLPRAYVAHGDDLPALRGRLDVVRQFSTLAASPHRLACRYDEFSLDVPLNQVLKAAVSRLRRLARGLATRRLLDELALAYADVATVTSARLPWRAIVPDRTNARWLTLVRHARLILGERFQNSTGGEIDGFALLFNMNALFERYLEKLLAPVARAAGWTPVAQGGLRHCLHPEAGGDPLFQTRPDLLLRRGDRIGMVLDAKWKRLTDPARDRTMGIAQADLYQSMAYARLYRCDRLALLYPHHGGIATPMPAYATVAGEPPVRLTVATLDLSSHAAAQAGLAALLAGLD